MAHGVGDDGRRYTRWAEGRKGEFDGGVTCGASGVVGGRETRVRVLRVRNGEGLTLLPHPR